MRGLIAQAIVTMPAETKVPPIMLRTQADFDRENARLAKMAEDLWARLRGPEFRLLSRTERLGVYLAYRHVNGLVKQVKKLHAKWLKEGA